MSEDSPITSANHVDIRSALLPASRPSAGYGRDPLLRRRRRDLKRAVVLATRTRGARPRLPSPRTSASLKTATRSRRPPDSRDPPVSGGTP